MKRNNKFELTLGIIMTVLSVLLFVGILTFFAPCGPKEDGSFMKCHEMGQAVMWTACAMTLFSGVSMFVPGMIKLVCSVVTVLLSAAAAVLPNVMTTCMSEKMQCNAVTKPLVMVIACLVAVVAVAKIAVVLKNRKKNGEA